jgi:carnosine N-methyltransferase
MEILQSGPFHSSPHNPEQRFSFAAGDFLEIYGNEANVGAWDAVVTCFFIDTAPVVLE